MRSDSYRALASDLRSRQTEIEEELLLAIPDTLRDPLGGADADFASTQREAISDALNYALNTLAGVRGRSTEMPESVLEQARRSARHSIGVDRVLSLWLAGRESLGAMITAESAHHGAEANRTAQAVLGSLLQRLVPVVTRAHQSETDRLRRSWQERRGARVRRLLNGELVDFSSIGYEFGAWHTALIVSGTGAQSAQSPLKELSRHALFVAQDDAAIWGWLSDSEPLASEEIESFVRQAAIPQAVFAIGEPAFGVDGWRLSHRLAQEARRVALVEPQPVTTYASVGVIAPWVLDRPYALAFIEAHLGPLMAMRDGGASARETLREIFKARHQVAAAASALKIDRGTLRTRLSRIEQRLGFPLPTRQAELEIALRLEAIYRPFTKP